MTEQPLGAIAVAVLAGLLLLAVEIHHAIGLRDGSPAQAGQTSIEAAPIGPAVSADALCTPCLR